MHELTERIKAGDVAGDVDWKAMNRIIKDYLEEKVKGLSGWRKIFTMNHLGLIFMPKEKVNLEELEHFWETTTTYYSPSNWRSAMAAIEKTLRKYGKLEYPEVISYPEAENGGEKCIN